MTTTQPLRTLRAALAGMLTLLVASAAFADDKAAPASAASATADEKATTASADEQAAAAGGKAASPKFKKYKLSDLFYSEGATYGDFNKDGKQDFAAGPFWYEGPDFQKKHEYYKGAPVDPKGYSANFFAYAHDFNKDGWADILILGFPGQESAWYENPKGKDGEWKRYVVAKVTDNESPAFADLTGDGKPELVFHTRGQLGWAEPDESDPTKEWTFHKASPRDDRFHRFTHGLGFGDVNGDGKKDFLEARGWWQQPKSLDGDPDWTFHPQEFFTKGFGDGGAQMFAYDVDGDGDNDVITSLQAHGCGLAWFEQTKEGGDIKFKRHLILSDKPGEKINGVQFAQLHAVELYDMDGDGLKDIVTGKRYWAHGPTGDIDPAHPPVVYWFRLTRDGGQVKWTPHLIDNDSGVGTQVTVGDLNGDGKGDVVVGNKRGQFVLIQEPERTASTR